MGRRNLRGRSRTERYVSLRYWLLQSPAWRSLPCAARALYIEIAARYNGRNNGRISYSVREGAKALKITKDTVGRMLKLLRERGFIVCTKRGAFSLKASKEASEWRLTEYADDVIPQHPTKDFMRWQPPEADQNRPQKFKTRSFSSDRTVRPERPSGTIRRTAKHKNGHDGPAGRTVSAQKVGVTVRPDGHLQLPGGYGCREAPVRDDEVANLSRAERQMRDLWQDLDIPPFLRREPGSRRPR